jgi:hypothetical protein
MTTKTAFLCRRVRYVHRFFSYSMRLFVAFENAPTNASGRLHSENCVGYIPYAEQFCQERWKGIRAAIR